jgi:hypothetical protein
MTLLHYDLARFPWWVVLLFVILSVLLVMSSGCATTCEPTIIKESVIVEVPVPIPPEPVPVPVASEMEVCNEGDIPDRVRCIGRNVERLRCYAEELLIEIEAHNAAIPQ